MRRGTIHFALGLLICLPIYGLRLHISHTSLLSHFLDTFQTVSAIVIERDNSKYASSVSYLWARIILLGDHPAMDLPYTSHNRLCVRCESTGIRVLLCLVFIRAVHHGNHRGIFLSVSPTMSQSQLLPAILHRPSSFSAGDCIY